MQELVADFGDCIITLSERCGVARPAIVDGRTILEPDSPVVWFTFPGAWFDIGRFHLANGEFTGLYANVITPIDLITRTHWHTTDLYLDLWLDRSGTLRVLDADELADAEQHDHIAPELASLARNEAERLIQLREAGQWPPIIVNEWTLERARAECAHS